MNSDKQINLRVTTKLAKPQTVGKASARFKNRLRFLLFNRHLLSQNNVTSNHKLIGF